MYDCNLPTLSQIISSYLILSSSAISLKFLQPHLFLPVNNLIHIVLLLNPRTSSGYIYVGVFRYPRIFPFSLLCGQHELRSPLHVYQNYPR